MSGIKPASMPGESPKGGPDFTQLSSLWRKLCSGSFQPTQRMQGPRSPGSPGQVLDRAEWGGGWNPVELEFEPHLGPVFVAKSHHQCTISCPPTFPHLLVANSAVLRPTPASVLTPWWLCGDPGSWDGTWASYPALPFTPTPGLSFDPIMYETLLLLSDSQESDSDSQPLTTIQGSEQLRVCGQGAGAASQALIYSEFWGLALQHGKETSSRASSEEGLQLCTPEVLRKFSGR